MLKQTIENEILSAADKVRAKRIASIFREKHGYWMAMYHVMTLMIWCRKNKTYDRWSEDDLINVTFWWQVRNYIWNSGVK